MLACEVVRRGPYLIAEALLTPSPPLGLGRARHDSPLPGTVVLVEPGPAGDTGAIVERLGPASDVDVLMHALAAERGLAMPFPAACLAEAAAVADDPPAPGDGRVDRRDALVVTIDPETAKDHDDALSLSVHPDGTRTLAVHIADVSAVVPRGGALDREAALRGFSAYLPGRVDPMLPAKLADGRCSLHAGRPRDVVTVAITLDGDTRPVGVTVERSQIVVARRLSYREVDDILAAGRHEDDLSTLLAELDDIADRRARVRTARGAIDLAAGEVELDLADGAILGARPRTETRAHRLVEESMLVCNEAVAGLLVEHAARAPFRIHDDPDPEAVEVLYARLAELRLPTPPLLDILTPHAATAAVAAAAAAAFPVARRERRLASTRLLVLRALRQARYGVDTTRHSGLGAAAYCHFTSPIRRYPDLLVHRALLAAIGLGPPPEHVSAELCEELSEREREVAAIEREGERIALAILLRRRLRDGALGDFDGQVTGLVGGGAFVTFDDVYDGFLPSRHLGRGRLDVDRLGVALLSRDAPVLRLGDRVRVHVDRVEPLQGRVDLSQAPSDGVTPDTLSAGRS